jgi:hypothetical protein
MESTAFIFRIEIPYVLNIIPAGSSETFRFAKHHYIGSPSLSLRMHDFRLSVRMPIKLSFQLWPRSEKVTGFLISTHIRVCVDISNT